jgi:hypothetical protein
MHGYGEVDVEIENLFNQDQKLLINQLHINIDRPEGYRVLNGVNTWFFQKRFFECKQYKNLVVIWRTKFISSDYPKFKDSYDSSYWDLIIPILKMQNFEVVEVDHRTSIREVFHLIASCRLIVCYNGMYHYIAKNLMKPMVVMGDSTIINMHNPQAVHFHAPHKDPSERDILDYLLNMRRNLGHLDGKVRKLKHHQWVHVFGEIYAGEI